MQEQVVLALQVVEKIGLPAATGFIGLLAWMWERKQNQAMQLKLVELATAQIAAAMKVEMALEAIKSIINTRSARR